LGQDPRFNSLHWFDEIKKKFEKDLKILKAKEEESKNLPKGAVRDDDDVENCDY